MEGIFVEFENENALRAYPFAAGCVPPDDETAIPADVFVDAAFYPVNPAGRLYLSSISDEGVFSVSDDSGVVMTGSASGTTVEFYDVTGLSRHVGTLVASSSDALANFAQRGVLREYAASATAFASNCVFPVCIDGVISVDVADSGMATGEISFANASTDVVRASSGTLDDGRRTLRFDVLPRLGAEGAYIRRVICVVDGQTPFRIKRHESSYNTIILTLTSDDGEATSFSIDKGVVCAAAHRENDYEMVDACECDKITTDNVPLPDTYQIEEVFIPPDPDGSEGGIEGGADNAFYLVVPNLLGYYNPLSITLQDGIVAPKVNDPEVVVDGYTASLADGEMLDDVNSKGIVLQVPGLSGGLI